MCFFYFNREMTRPRCDVGHNVGDGYFLLICEIILDQIVLLDMRQLDDKIRLAYYFSLKGLRLKSLTDYSFETMKLLIK